MSGEEPATGLTLYPDAVLRAAPRRAEASRVFLPAGADPAAGAALRAKGFVTVQALSQDDDPRHLDRGDKGEVALDIAGGEGGRRGAGGDQRGRPGQGTEEADHRRCLSSSAARPAARLSAIRAASSGPIRVQPIRRRTSGCAMRK